MIGLGGDRMRWRKKDKLEKIMVEPNSPLLDSLPKMEEAALQVLLVIDDQKKLVGTVTDGDIRRALLNGLDLRTQIKNVMNPRPRALMINSSIKRAMKFMESFSLKHVPLVDAEGKLQDLIIWSDCFQIEREKHQEKVIIMAGGRGTRLDPFTKILPKPMIPLGDKPIIETIMDKLYQQGFSEFIITLGYKAEIIKMYFAETSARPYKINFSQEIKPLGTAGAMKLVQGQINSTALITNCDVIIEPNYVELLEHHRKEKNLMTLVSTVKDYTIPYGVIKTEGQELEMIEEKPSFHFMINTGLYIIEPEVIEFIQDDENIDMTDLMIRIKEDQKKVGVYPHHGKWFDVGQWEDYRNTIRQFGVLD